jgi:NAD-dependent deacetylase
MFETLGDQLQKAKKIVFLTGAGMSQESGLPTFRGTNGLWKKHDPTKLATTEAFYKEPNLVWEWYYDRRRKILAAKPNAGHIAIAKIEKYKEVWVLTQNIDGLHQIAQSKNVIELHGNIFKTKCIVCDFKGQLYDEFPPLPPTCNLGHILRPDIVWFDEDIPQEIWQKATAEASNCDAMIIVGTSLVVEPANQLPLLAKEHGAKLIEINIEETQYTTKMDLSIRATAVNGLTELVEFLKG